jgi:hypothetical protein
MKPPHIGQEIEFEVAGEETWNKGKVFAIFKSLDEDWDTYGHDAMAIEDQLTDEQIKKAKWFACVEHPDYGHMAVASFEVKQ